jgi:BirA family biotin operon repressor/biotin-[acetyl-CoA-carboxylase] ligase
VHHPDGARDLTPAALLPLLKTARLGRTFDLLPSCGSTNDVLTARAPAAGEGLLVAANEQTNGRGRRGRAWHSPPGENLYASLLLRPSRPARQAASLTLIAGVAVAQALGGLGFSPRLKWPNDVILETDRGRYKVAGLLVEMASEGERVRHVILGLGVNVNAGGFPAELASVATSLRLVCGAPIERAAVLAGFLNAFEPLYDDWLAHGSAAGLAAWTSHAILGQRGWVDRGGERIEGVATAVDESGALLLRTDSGATIPIHAGEVNWLGTR